MHFPSLGSKASSTAPCGQRRSSPRWRERILDPGVCLCSRQRDIAVGVCQRVRDEGPYHLADPILVTGGDERARRVYRDQSPGRCRRPIVEASRSTTDRSTGS